MQQTIVLSAVFRDVDSWLLFFAIMLIVISVREDAYSHEPTSWSVYKLNTSCQNKKIIKGGAR